MRAKSVNETIGFERYKDPKRALFDLDDEKINKFLLSKYYDIRPNGDHDYWIQIKNHQDTPYQIKKTPEGYFLYKSRQNSWNEYIFYKMIKKPIDSLAKVFQIIIDKHNKAVEWMWDSGWKKIIPSKEELENLEY